MESGEKEGDPIPGSSGNNVYLENLPQTIRTYPNLTLPILNHLAQPNLITPQLTSAHLTLPNLEVWALKLFETFKNTKITWLSL
jgi:hypothetical protein